MSDDGSDVVGPIIVLSRLDIVTKVLPLEVFLEFLVSDLDLEFLACRITFQPVLDVINDFSPMPYDAPRFLRW